MPDAGSPQATLSLRSGFNSSLLSEMQSRATSSPVVPVLLACTNFRDLVKGRTVTPLNVSHAEPHTRVRSGGAKRPLIIWSWCVIQDEAKTEFCSLTELSSCRCCAFTNLTVACHVSLLQSLLSDLVGHVWWRSTGLSSLSFPCCHFLLLLAPER